MKTFFQQYIKNNPYAALIYNLFIVMLLFMVSRIVFFCVNQSYFEDMTLGRFLMICEGGLKFDLTAVVYTNLLYVLMMAIPFKFRYNNKYQTGVKWLFILSNSIMLVINSIDMIYFKFTNRRSTLSVFSEFEHENNMSKIFLQNAVEYWYVVFFGIAILFLLYKLYHKPLGHNVSTKSWRYYLQNTAALFLIIFLSVSGIRGGWLWDSFVRPITLSNANKYVEKPLEASIVLNTPFCVLRTIGSKPYKNPGYFKTEKDLKAVYNPIIYPRPNGEFKNLNVVVFILESFSKEYVGELNKDLDGGKYKGYTPFLDSLIREGLTFEYTFSTGRKSIDAMPSVLSSIPAFFEPYFLTVYSNNKVSGIAGELNKKGYYTAFFHGAPNGSMGFQAFAKVTGFKDYYGMAEYGNDKDYDGTWAIWDEEFFQFYANKMSTFKQPFMTTLFSASSHSPFVVPERYKDRFPEEGGHKIHKCIRYTDYSLRRFFETASKQPWFDNTLFVITADHTNALQHAEYLNDAGTYKVPIVFYHPKGNLKGRIKDIAQQTDIMPTILGYLNYDKPFIAFGHDLLDPNYKEHYAINFNNQIFQYFKGDYMFQFDGNKIIAAYDFVNDVFLKNNLKGKLPQQLDAERQIKAIIQQYVERMMNNNLYYK